MVLLLLLLHDAHRLRLPACHNPPQGTCPAHQQALPAHAGLMTILAATYTAAFPILLRLLVLSPC